MSCEAIELLFDLGVLEVEEVHDGFTLSNASKGDSVEFSSFLRTGFCGSFSQVQGNTRGGS